MILYFGDFGEFFTIFLGNVMADGGKGNSKAGCFTDEFAGTHPWIAQI
jgi:hypothetical protein